jgi:hypothetical protein
MMDYNPIKTPTIVGIKLHIYKEEEPTANTNLYR